MPFKDLTGTDLTRLLQSVSSEVPSLSRRLTHGDWRAYGNGNYTVLIDLDDGTKIRVGDDDTPFIADTPESMDVKITNRCDAGCPWCHEGSVPTGANADISQAFLDTLHPYTEIAVGGGNVFEHPELETFLAQLAERGCIPSITVNQRHLEGENGDEILDKILHWRAKRLVYGVGISVSNPTKRLVEIARAIDTSVLHVVNGLFDEKTFEALRGRGLRILILGYKDVRRGRAYHDGNHSDSITHNMAWLSENLGSVVSGFSVASFDNLALEQLPVKQMLGEDAWESFYMGDDGQHTFYIDMVDKKYSVSSTAGETDRRPIGHRSVDEMFADVRNTTISK